MANAKRCDRCDACFDPRKVWGLTCRFKNPSILNTKGQVQAHLVSDADPDEWVDLCPDCTTRFLIFMGTGTMNKEESE